MTVVHVSPTHFAVESVIGGGERFVEELSRAMAERVAVRLVSFGPAARRERLSATYERVILRSWTRDQMTPFSPLLWHELSGAQVIHCHQYYTLPTFLSALYGRLAGIPVFVSDLGGGGWTPGYRIDISRWISAHLPISRYAASRLPGTNRNFAVIYGGADLRRYQPRAALVHDGSVVFLGRILPHKGIHFLIEGLPAETALTIIGPVGDRDYLARLHALAAGKRVHFVHTLTDAEVVEKLRSAMALVHPTPTDGAGSAGANELLCLAVIEAMASNCAAVVTNAASLPEIVEHERSGLVVPPNDAAAIGDAIRRLAADAALWAALVSGARRRVETEFVWSRTVERCLSAYSTVRGPAFA
jgi:glycosyltransferase involved in cell wall biosynthesis